MPKIQMPVGKLKLEKEQIDYLQEKMNRIADRNPSAGISRTDYPTLFNYLAVQKKHRKDKVPF
jgi:hypothetical protein